MRFEQVQAFEYSLLIVYYSLLIALLEQVQAFEITLASGDPMFVVRAVKSGAPKSEL
jgi:hypothetical protein